MWLIIYATMIFIPLLCIWLSLLILIFTINKIFKKKIPFVWSFYAFCLCCVIVVVLLFGISFKYLDPDYYRFKKVCQNNGLNLYNEQLYKEIQEANIIIKADKERLYREIENEIESNNILQDKLKYFLQTNIVGTASKEEIDYYRKKFIINLLHERYIIPPIILSNGKKAQKESMRSWSDINEKGNIYLREGEVYYYLEDKQKIPVAIIGFYIYYAPSIKWILPSDAGIGGIERYDTEYCGKSNFN